MPDNLITGNVSNISHIIENDAFQWFNYDVSELGEISKDVDVIFHLASPASPIDYLNFPIETMKVGALGTLNLLQLARKNDSAFLISSTSEVYGDPLENPQHEEYWGNVNPIGPRSVYDESKRYAEALTMAFHREYGLNTKIVRIFNTYGPRMKWDDGRVVPGFINQALKNEPLTIFGNGSQTRSFCYVSDLIDGIYKASSTDYNLPINLGNPGEITILDFAKKIIEIVGSKDEFEFIPLPEDDPRVRSPDITKAREILGFNPIGYQYQSPQVYTAVFDAGNGLKIPADTSFPDHNGKTQS